VADIFKEVEEELKKDKALEWWKKYSPYVYGAAAVIVLGTGGWQGWQVYDRNSRTESSEQMAAAVELARSGDSEGAIAALSELRDSGASGYRLLAGFENARLLAERGDTAGAIAIWDGIAESSAASPAFKGLAEILSVLHQMETADPEVLSSRLAGLAGPGQPYRASALELQAVLAMKKNDHETARTLYTQVTDDPEAPLGVRRRAAVMLDALPAPVSDPAAESAVPAATDSGTTTEGGTTE